MKDKKPAIIGLGYVRLSLAVEFGKTYGVKSFFPEDVTDVRL